MFSHFEDDAIGSFNENSSVEYSISIDDNAITGAPISYQDSIDSDISNNIANNNFDFGIWMDSTADIHPNKLKHAICGTLTIKYVILSFIHQIQRVKTNF